jgi:membrane peptidoglycan carboxypeptidase
MREILRRVVTHGTGRLARGELHVSLDDLAPEGTPKPNPPNPDKFIRVPAFGKTGTTNDFTTANFAGFLPYPVEKGGELDPTNSYVIAAYVGYDHNKTMTRGRFKVYGGAGALPLWTDFAKEIIEEKKYVEKLDPLDLSVISQKVWPVKFDKAVSPLMVDLPRGLVIRSGGTSESEMFGATDIATTGESFTNQYALGSSVKSVVYVPPDFSGGTWQPLKMFAPFTVQKSSGDSSEGDLPGVTPAPEVQPAAKVSKEQVPGSRISTADPKRAGTASPDKPIAEKPVADSKEIEPAEKVVADPTKTDKPDAKDDADGKGAVFEPDDEAGYNEEDLW